MASHFIYVIGCDSRLINALEQASVKHCLLVSHAEDIPVHRDVFVQCIIIDRPNFFMNDALKEASSIQTLRTKYPTSFIAIFDPEAAYKPHYRLECFDYGANMVAHDIQSLCDTLFQGVIPTNDNGPRKCKCPYCNLSGLTDREMWNHIPIYHVNVPFSTENSVCPICNQRTRRPMQVHVHERHAPFDASRAIASHTTSDRVSITQLFGFALVVCRHPITGRYLLCQEFANQGFWLPGGGIEPSETITSAAVRETIEEAGINIELKGVLAIEYNPCGLYENQTARDYYLVRMRVIFFAEPALEDLNKPPKSSPDFESAGACWCSVEDIFGPSVVQNSTAPPGVKLRGSEPRKWIKHLETNGNYYPMDILREKTG